MSTISASTTSTTAYKVTADTTGTLVLQTGSTPTTAVTIDTAQNMGLGVTPSTWSTGKAQEFNTVGNAIWSTGANDLRLLANIYYNGGYKYATTASASMYQVSGGYHSWYVAASGTAGNSITFTQAMTLDASGNLGVGTTSPNGKLSVAGNITLEPGGSGPVASSRPQLWRGADGFLGIQSGGDTGGVIAFHTSSSGTPSERARIDSSGNLLVGLTSAASRKFYVVGDTSNYLSTLANTNSSPYGLQISYTGAAPNGTLNHFIYAEDSSALRMSLRSNGGIANYSANNSNLSDRREKTNFAPAGDYLAKICAIPVQTFNYIDQNMEEDGGLTLGVVAQDVQAVAPELVTESDWSAEKDGSKMRLSVYQTDLQYALMKAIQEQQAIIETLTNRITALEAK